LIAVGVFEHCKRSQNFSFGLFRELDAFGCQRLRGSKNVVAPESQRMKSADAILMARWREEREPGVGARNQKSDPALAVAIRLVGGDFETEFFGIKFQRGMLVANRNSGDLDSSCHGSLLG
jgi:hypothetical protein